MFSFYVFDQGTALGSGDPVNAPKSVYKITEAWNVSSVTWSKMPKFDSTTAISSNTNTKTAVWEDYDVTAVVKAIVENEAANNGFMLKFPEEIDYKGARIHSSDCAEADKQYRPKLTITYTSTSINNTSLVGGSEKLAMKQNGHAINFLVPFNKSYTAVVYNAAGHAIQTMIGTGPQWQAISSVSFSNGIYFIAVSSGDKTVSKKFSIIR